MGTSMDIVIWTIAFLSSTLNLKGEANATPSSPQNEVISSDPPVTLSNTAVETQHVLSPGDVVSRPQTQRSHTVALGLYPPPEPVTALTTHKIHTASLQASTQSITGPDTRTEQDISLSFVPLKKSAVPQESITTPASTAASPSPSEEHQTSSVQSTIPTSEAESLVPSVSPSGVSSILTTLTDNPETTGLAPLENFNQDTPSELDVGDETSGGGHPASPLDLLLTGLVSVFIFSTALLSIMLFLRFRQQSRHPEFHRLQDLPMDDLLEDTPLSRYSY